MEIEYTKMAESFIKEMRRWFHQDDVTAVILAAKQNSHRVTRPALRSAFLELSPVSDREPDPNTDAEPLGDCGCVLPEQSCRRCRAAAREAAGGDDEIPF